MRWFLTLMLLITALAAGCSTTQITRSTKGDFKPVVERAPLSIGFTSNQGPCPGNMQLDSYGMCGARP